VATATLPGRSRTIVVEPLERPEDVPVRPVEPPPEREPPPEPAEPREPART
jgi:hypothetical protein